jgi:hypothetical protein
MQATPSATTISTMVIPCGSFFTRIPSLPRPDLFAWEIINGMVKTSLIAIQPT